jgi:hypothetical protein
MIVPPTLAVDVLAYEPNALVNGARSNNVR